jgi:hypothetical protein
MTAQALPVIVDSAEGLDFWRMALPQCDEYSDANVRIAIESHTNFFVALPRLVYAVWAWYETGLMLSSIAIILLAGQWTTRRPIDLRTKEDRQPHAG